jgi:hypothetical protein
MGIDEEQLHTAIALGNAICNELDICCERRGRVIFEVYKKLQQLQLQKAVTGKLEPGLQQPEGHVQPSLGEG